MLRIILVSVLFASVALSQETFYEYFKEPEQEQEVLVLKEDLPPGALIRVRRQFLGGVNRFPGGGFQQQAGYRGSLFNNGNKELSGWSSLSQNFDKRGFSSPITYSGGLDLNTQAGSGLSLSGSHVPKVGSQATLGGSLNLLNTPDHRVNAFGSHTKIFDPNFREIGRGSSTAGAGYQHAGGAGLSVSGTHTPGLPNSGSISGQLPLHTSKDGLTSVTLIGQSNFASEQKPQHQVGLGVEHRF